MSEKRTKIQKNFVFNIRIGSNIEKIDLKDQLFLRILEQEYATKYLQTLGIEANGKNIQRILKDNPLEKCEIIQSRLNGGLHTDTITIMPKKVDNTGQNHKGNSQTVSNEMLEILDLKKMNVKKKMVKQNIEIGKYQLKTTHNVEKQEQGLQFLSFNIKDIQNKYIFPFNDTFKRKHNYKIKDSYDLMDCEEGDSKIIFESKIFHFPFTQVKLSLNVLKQLQNPIETKLIDIKQFLDKFYQFFPHEIFPIKTQIKQKSSYIYFQKKNIDQLFEILRSEENCKFIGMFLHMAYWSIFGAVNPIQIQTSMRRKMYIVMFETLEYFQLKVNQRKIWSNLVFPMILLTLKMATDYFFIVQYPKLFQSQQNIKQQINQLAYDKILFFIEKIFDQSNIHGRFIFLQSQIDGPKGNFAKDNKFIKKRIFGISPGLPLILSNPKNGKARSIMTKNIQIDQRQGIINQQIKLQEHLNQSDQQTRSKLLQLTLFKITNRMQDIFKSDHNSIIKLNSQ